MSGTGRTDAPSALGGVRRLAGEAQVLAAQRDDSNSWVWLTVPRIRQLLDRSVDLLAEAAHDAGDDDRRARALRAARDEISAHLRAAEHVEAAKPQQTAHVDLVMRAVDVLCDALDHPA